eukprot:CAMPEP_0178386490 /NCGR_PEP_ID=MMETSP0689_2-20121128/8590_1 /TAXON_ID=160604 /ORGANISM="Amphidinium massartii, Strain CS-259" /LENGTH=72 /DNA_ID=CAMNT_0020006835 /DNA_START=44 /DNA_END=262 /DNA_ORIENTATION=-
MPPLDFLTVEVLGWLGKSNAGLDGFGTAKSAAELPSGAAGAFCGAIGAAPPSPATENVLPNVLPMAEKMALF